MKQIKINSDETANKDFMQGFELRGDGYKLHGSFIDEGFKNPCNIVDIYERTITLSNNLTTSSVTITKNKINDVEIIDGIENINKYLDALADSGRKILNDIRVLILKDEIERVNFLIELIENKVPTLEQGISIYGKLPFSNELEKRFNLILITIYKAKINQIQNIVIDTKELLSYIEKPKNKKEDQNELNANYILDLDEIKINNSFMHFKDWIGISNSEYLNCFNSNISTPKYPKIKKGKLVSFVYFLSEAGANAKIAEKRFDIKSYHSLKNRAYNDYPPSAPFLNLIKHILNKTP